MSTPLSVANAAFSARKGSPIVYRYRTISAAVVLGLGGMALGMPQAMAALPPGTILQIAPGVVVCNGAGGTPPNACVSATNVPSGSYFAMDMNGNGSFQGSEKTALAPGPDGGLIMGQIQSGLGTHSGPPNGTETAGVDAPWSFFGNTGLDWTTSAPTVLTDDGAGNLTLSLKGWTVAWNGIETIPMGGDLVDYPSTAGFPTADTGVATLTCSTPTCANGDTFTLDYYAHVPKGNSSGFGGVFYGLHLVGTIVIPAPPSVTSSVGVVSPGGTASGQGLTKPLMTAAQLASAGVPSDPGVVAGSMCSGGCFDFKITGVSTGATAMVVLALNSGIPKNAVFRKFNTATSSWSPFDTSKGDTVASAPLAAGGVCPVPGAAAYTSGLTIGNFCVELAIKDGGPNDMSPTAGEIDDPSGVGVLPSVSGTGATLPSGTSGCSISPTPVSAWRGGAWWMIGMMIGWLGFSRRRRARQPS